MIHPQREACDKEKVISPNFKFHLINYPDKGDEGFGKNHGQFASIRGERARREEIAVLAHPFPQQPGSSLVLNQTNINKEDQLLLQ